jgi:hypothetical protein
MKKLLTNRAKCLRCGDVIESTHRHDFRWCSCGAIAVDGGQEYLRRVGDLSVIAELSEYDSNDLPSDLQSLETK